MNLKVFRLETAEADPNVVVNFVTRLQNLAELSLFVELMFKPVFGTSAGDLTQAQVVASLAGT